MHTSFVDRADDGLSWQLLYTKPHAETWVEANLRAQGYSTLLPRAATRSGLGPLFPRYVFAGFAPPQRPDSFAGTYGVAYVVRCGNRPARVPRDVIVSISERMNEQGIVRVDRGEGTDESIFTSRARDRVAVLARFAEAGFRVRSA
ncbi:MAG: transcriptional regulator [Gemmatimonadetes bacterium]|jgi:hypothetical protein|nr:transcriptional regulator [Gemmatimonadota bacterium]